MSAPAAVSSPVADTEKRIKYVALGAGSDPVTKALSNIKASELFRENKKNGLYLYSKIFEGKTHYLLDTIASVQELSKRIKKGKEYTLVTHMADFDAYKKFFNISDSKVGGTRTLNAQQLADKEAREAIAVDNRVVGTMSRATFENTILTKLCDEMMATPHGKAQIEYEVAREIGQRKLEPVQIVEIRDAKRVAFQEEVLNAVRTEFVQLCLHVQEARFPQLSAHRSFKPSSYANAVTEFDMWRAKNGFNVFLIDHPAHDSIQASVSVMHWETWVQRMNEYRSLGIPVAGLKELGDHRYGPQDEKKADAARAIKSDAERAMQKKISEMITEKSSALGLPA